MSKRLLDKKLPKNLNEASFKLKNALSAFEDAIDDTKNKQTEQERKTRKRMLLKIKTLLQGLS